MELVAWLMDAGGRDGPIGLEELLHRPQWMAVAACRDEPTETFFPRLGGTLSRARELCAGCSVRPDCLEYALALVDYEAVGCWGGTSERERRRTGLEPRRGGLTVRHGQA